MKWIRWLNLLELTECLHLPLIMRLKLIYSLTVRDLITQDFQGYKTKALPSLTDYLSTKLTEKRTWRVPISWAFNKYKLREATLKTWCPMQPTQPGLLCSGFNQLTLNFHALGQLNHPSCTEAPLLRKIMVSKVTRKEDIWIVNCLLIFIKVKCLRDLLSSPTLPLSRVVTSRCLPRT